MLSLSYVQGAIGMTWLAVTENVLITWIISLLSLFSSLLCMVSSVVTIVLAASLSSYILLLTVASTSVLLFQLFMVIACLILAMFFLVSIMIAVLTVTVGCYEVYWSSSSVMPGYPVLRLLLITCCVGSVGCYGLGVIGCGWLGLALY